MSNLYLTQDQKDLFFDNLDRLKHAKLEKKGLSLYALREAETIFQANEDLNKTSLPGVVYLKHEVEKEFNRLDAVIKKHPRLKDKYEGIKADILRLKNVSPSNNLVMEKIIRLECALGMEINLKHVDIIDSVFNDIYMDLVNHHYQDAYQIVKKS